MYVERRCVAALGNNLLTNILRRYAASILIVDYSPRVTAATRASPELTSKKRYALILEYNPYLFLSKQH